MVYMKLGLFGWGNQRPLYNYGSHYWPVEDLKKVNPNFHVVDVGIASSDHDRACETFYQLVGGRVDYGAAHAQEKGWSLCYM